MTNPTVAETIAALHNDREMYERMNGRGSKTRIVDVALAHLERLQAENKRLREALEPFADVADQWPEDESGATEIVDGAYSEPPLRLHHFRRARAALAREEGR